MRLLLTILFFGILNFLGCSDDDIRPETRWCGSAEPLQDLDWLRKIHEGFQVNPGTNGQKIYAYRYQNQDVFWINDCFGCADEMVVVYDCNGVEVCRFGGIAGFNTCPEFPDDSSDQTLLFSNVLD